MIASGGVTVPEADVTNCGGVTVFIKIAHLAEAFNLPTKPDAATVYTEKFLPPIADRMLPKS